MAVGIARRVLIITGRQFIREEFPAVSDTHLRDHETRGKVVCRLLPEKKNRKKLVADTQVVAPTPLRAYETDAGIV